MDKGIRRWERRGASARAYFVREALELCLVIGGLAIADGITRVPLWVWMALPGGKTLFSILFYVLLLRRSLQRQSRHEPASLIGRTAHTLAPLNPEGQVTINGGIWRAQSRTGNVIPSHHDVLIREACGHLLLVEVQTTDKSGAPSD